MYKNDMKAQLFVILFCKLYLQEHPCWKRKNTHLKAS